MQPWTSAGAFLKVRACMKKVPNESGVIAISTLLHCHCCPSPPLSVGADEQTSSSSNGSRTPSPQQCSASSSTSANNASISSNSNSSSNNASGGRSSCTSPVPSAETYSRKVFVGGLPPDIDQGKFVPPGPGHTYEMRTSTLTARASPDYEYECVCTQAWRIHILFVHNYAKQRAFQKALWSVRWAAACTWACVFTCKLKPPVFCTNALLKINDIYFAVISARLVYA